MGDRNEAFERKGPTPVNRENEGYSRYMVGFINSRKLLRALDWVATTYKLTGDSSPDDMLTRIKDPVEKGVYRTRIRALPHSGPTLRHLIRRIEGLEVWKTGPGEDDIEFVPRFPKPKRSKSSSS